MNSTQYQNMITAIRRQVTVRDGHVYTRQQPGRQTFTFDLHTYVPDCDMEFVYDTSMYIIGYIIGNHGYRFQNVSANFSTEGGAAITGYSGLDVPNNYTDTFRNATQNISVLDLERILSDLRNALRPGDNVSFPRNSHQKLFVGFAEAVRFGDILRDILQDTPLNGLNNRLDWNARSSRNDPAVAVK